MRFVSFNDEVRFWEAVAFADRFHHGQLRKYDGQPYIVHPQNVASLVNRAPGHTLEMLQAAVLHDVLEDTSASEADVEANFGPVVLRYVLALTDERFGQDKVGNRKFRKEQTALRLSKEGYEVHTIKVADMLDNSVSIVQHDPNFAKVFMREMNAMLNVLGLADKALLHTASLVVADYLYKESEL